MPADPATLRTLTVDDAAAWLAIRRRMLQEHPEAFGRSYSEAPPMPEVEERFRSLDGSARFVLGAFVGGSLIGTLGFMRSDREKERHKAGIWGVYVAPEVRGRGIGRMLMEETLRRARALDGLARVSISVNAVNVAARELYLSCGFEIWGREEDALRVDGASQTEEHMALEVRPETPAAPVR